MRNKIFGGIGVLWGTSVFVRWLITPAASNEAYQAGSNLGAIFGVSLIAVGLYTFFKKPKPKTEG